MGRQPGATCTESSLAVSCPVRHVVSLRARDSLRGIHPGETKAHVHTDLSTNALSSFIHNSPKLERTRMSCRVRGTHPGLIWAKDQHSAVKKSEPWCVLPPGWIVKQAANKTSNVRFLVYVVPEKSPDPWAGRLIVASWGPNQGGDCGQSQQTFCRGQKVPYHDCGVGYMSGYVGENILRESWINEIRATIHSAPPGFQAVC